MVHATTLTVLSKGFVGSLGAGQRGEKTPGSGGRRIQVSLRVSLRGRTRGYS